MKSPVTLPASPAPARPSTGRRRRSLYCWVPIRRLNDRHRAKLQRHLLALDARDRYLRFGYPASDEAIHHHVQALDFTRSDLFGLFDRRLELVAIAQLAYVESAALPGAVAATTQAREPSATPTEFAAQIAGDATSMAEFAVSVRQTARGRGYGQRLFDHALRHARNLGIDRLMIHALTENANMLRIARQAGAVVQRAGSESEAWLRLPPGDLHSRLGEWLADRLAAIDLQWKRAMRLLRSRRIAQKPQV